MDDIFAACREGNLKYLKQWLDNIENDPNAGDEHCFTALHWAAWHGHDALVDALLSRGVKVQPTNMGDDTPLHCAAQHDQRTIILKLLKYRSDVDAINQHGNTPLHYACFWNCAAAAEELVNQGAMISICNKYNKTPLDLAKPSLRNLLYHRAEKNGQSLERIEFKDIEEKYRTQTMKSRPKDGTLNKHLGIEMSQLDLKKKLCESPAAELWKGRWQGIDIAAKIFKTNRPELDLKRVSRDLQTEYPRLRIFSHQNIHPVISNVNCVTSPTSAYFVLVSELLPYGSLFNFLHSQEIHKVVVDQRQILSIARDIVEGMTFLHNLEPILPRLFLTSKHVLLDHDLVAKINMGDVKMSFQYPGKTYSPEWMAPEALEKAPADINIQAADMWSFSVIVWELITREVPFPDMNKFEVGFRIVYEKLRLAAIPTACAETHLSKLMNICRNEDPAKRPRFDQILPVIKKMLPT